MSRPITPAEFHAAKGVADRRVLTSDACAYFRGTFDQVRNLVTDTADIRPDGITIRLPLTEASIDEARRISAAARDLGATPDPARLQHVGLTVDALVSADVMPFWPAVLGTSRKAARTSSTRAAGVPASGSRTWICRDQTATGCTSTCRCRTTRPSSASRTR